jgi:hypothetical protein
MPGSVILVLSPAHLANVGISAYISDYLSMADNLVRRFGREIRVGPLPPFLLAGVHHSTVVRELFEFITWTGIYYDGCDHYMEETFAAAKIIMQETGVGEQLYMEAKRMRLPASYKNNEKMLWHSEYRAEGENIIHEKLPHTITAMLQPKEEKLVLTLLEELRSKLALDLDTSPAFERGLGQPSKAKLAVDFLVIGSSNASKLSTALGNMGYACSLVFEANWRIGRSSVDHLARRTAAAIADMDPAVVVLQLLDNSCYYGRSRDGSRTAAKKGDDGKYHLEGEVTVCTYDTQLEHLKAIKSILDAVGKKACLLVTPLPRYVVAGCCHSPEHCSNRRYQDYREHLMASLEILRKNFKDFLFYDGRRNIKVFDPSMDLRGMADEEAWGDDPIHPTDEAFNKMAASVAKIGLREGAKRSRTDSLEAGSVAAPYARRGRH